MLCTHLDHDCLIAGGFDGYTYLVDPRGPGILSRHRYHRGSVLSLAVDDKQVVSVGDDSMLVVLDRHGDKACHVPVSLLYNITLTTLAQ